MPTGPALKGLPTGPVLGVVSGQAHGLKLHPVLPVSTAVHIVCAQPRDATGRPVANSLRRLEIRAILQRLLGRFS